MGLAPSLVIQLPGYPFENFPSVATIDLLRAVPSAAFGAEDNYVVDGGSVAGDGGGGVFAWSAGSTAADDGVSIIRPSDKSPGQAGRWVLTGKGLLDGRASLADLASTAPGKGASLVGYKRAASTAVARTLSDKASDIINAKDFGQVGDGVADDTAAINAAIAYCLSLPAAAELRISGSSKVSGLAEISGPITISGDNPRGSALVFSGTSDAVRIRGVSTRATAVEFRNISLNGNAMTAGRLVSIDWAQDVTFDNVVFNNPWNAVYARQVGRLHFNQCTMDTVRGEVGVDLFGNNTARNGENDQIDVAAFTDCVVQSNLPSVGGTNSTIMLRVDGRVHTIQCDGLRLLNGGIGLQTKNTPGLASNFIPRFIVGSSLEVENMYAECLDLQACREFQPAFLFAVGSHTADGIKLSSAVSMFAPTRASINSNALHGLNTNGAASVRLNNPLIYNNSTAVSAAKSGIYVLGSGLVLVDGGLCGKDGSLPAYAEPQKYGVEMDPAFNGILIMDGVDTRGNATGPIYDNTLSAVGSSINNCPGYNPRGIASQAASASPWTIVAGTTQENWMIAGTGISVSIAGVAVPSSVMAATGGEFTLNPRQSAVITYTTLPTVVVTRA